MLGKADAGPDATVVFGGNAHYRRPLKFNLVTQDPRDGLPDRTEQLGLDCRCCGRLHPVERGECLGGSKSPRLGTRHAETLTRAGLEASGHKPTAETHRAAVY